MKKSNVIILGFIIFIAGFLSGLLWASYKGPPPALESAAQPKQPSTTAQSAPAPVDTTGVQEKIKDIEAAIKANPGQAELYVQAGNLLFDHELNEQAITYYEQALEIGGPDPDLLTDTGICYRRLGRPEKAVEYFRKARAVDPKHPLSALNLGIVLFHDLQDKKQALEAWREYLALDPQGQRADMIRKVVAQIEAEGAGN